MSGQATMRLQRELRDCRQSLGNQIFVRWDDGDITRCRALITGPPGTPYAHGFFEFSLKFPPTYPSSPPKVEILTTNGGRTRFNPNLYAQGKVCLSILGTWGGRESEQWSSAHGITSVLISIQSLMSENPYENEPGYGKDEVEAASEIMSKIMGSPKGKGSLETANFTSSSSPSSSSSSSSPKAPLPNHTQAPKTKVSSGKTITSLPGSSATKSRAISSADTPYPPNPPGPTPSSSTNGSGNEEPEKSKPKSNLSLSSLPTVDFSAGGVPTPPAQSKPQAVASKKRLRDETTPELMRAYNLKISHETIRISVCGRIEHILGISKYSILSGMGGALANPGDGGLATVFDDQLKRLFLWYVNEYKACVMRGQKEVGDGESFRKMPFEMPSNIMMGSFNWSNLLERLDRICMMLLEEPEMWVKESADWLSRDITSASNLRDQHLQIKEGHEGLEGLDVELDEGNPYVWNVTIFGSPMSHYDGGMFKGKMTFHKDFPDILPRFIFSTRIYNPHITTDGVPYYVVEREDSVLEHMQALVSLFSSDPSPDPSTHVNKEAANLYFGNKEERKQYMRNARRCAARSMEED